MLHALGEQLRAATEEEGQARQQVGGGCLVDEGKGHTAVAGASGRLGRRSRDSAEAAVHWANLPSPPPGAIRTLP